MSYDISAVCPCCHGAREVWVNYTYNIGPMLRQIADASVKDLDGQTNRPGARDSGSLAGAAASQAR